MEGGNDLMTVKQSLILKHVEELEIVKLKSKAKHFSVMV